MTPAVRLSIIIVSTNEWHVLGPCLESVYRETSGFPFEVIVIDNASVDGTSAHVAQEFPQVSVVCSDKNRGFAASNNVGIGRALGAYVLLLNPDTIIHNGAITKTLAFMENMPRAGVCGCILRLKDGSIQQSLRSFPSVWNVFSEASFLYLAFPRTRLFGQYYMSHFAYDAPLRVDWLCGAFFMIRHSVLDTIGGLDEQFFMYTEEVDFCLRARKAGFETWFYSGAAITHLWGGMTAANRRVVVWTHGSQLMFLHKHFLGIHGIIIRSLKCWGLLNRLIVRGVAGVLTGRRSRIVEATHFGSTLKSYIQGRWRYQHGYTGPVEPWPLP
jgi:GT2 family glycosyltransferase